MTNKYYYVRREVWIYNKKNKFRLFRSFARMRKLFSIWTWILLIVMIICDFLFGFILVTFTNVLWSIIPFVIMLIIVLLADVLPESIRYNMKEREKEIKEDNDSISEHINGLVLILDNLNVNSLKQRNLLKSECENRITAYQNSVNTFFKNIFNLLVIAPSIAVITAVVSKENTNANAFAIILCAGLFLMFISKTFSPLFVIWNDINKDKVLLDELTELEYYDK